MKRVKRAHTQGELFAQLERAVVERDVLMQLVACEVALLYVPDGQAARRGTEECNQPDKGGV